MVKGIVIRGHFDKVTGYGVLASGLAEILIKSGLTVSLLPIDKCGELPKMLGDAVNKEVNPVFEIYAQPEFTLYNPEKVKHPRIWLTMLESTGLSNVGKAEMTKTDGILVSNRESLAVISASLNRTKGIGYCPLWCDYAEFRDGIENRKDKNKDTFTFGYVFDIYPDFDKGDRKNVMCLIRAFQKAFAGNTKVRLVLKTGEHTDIPELDDDRIDVIRGTLARSELAALIQGLDAYVSPARAEGWGWCVINAIAAGVPVIGVPAFGVGEYLQEGVNGKRLDYYWGSVPKHCVQRGMWPYIDEEHLIYLLRTAPDWAGALDKARISGSVEYYRKRYFTHRFLNTISGILYED